MNSDFKYYPTSLPRVLQSGYANKHKPNIIRTTMSDGYVRQRIVNQGAPDSLNVSITMTEADYRIFLTWYKSDIRSGQDWFVMPLLATEGDQSIQYKYVRIQNGEVNAQLVSTNASVGSIYKLSMTLDVSNTVVDDGSWNPDVPTGPTDDEVVDFAEFTDESVVDDADDLGDATDELTIVES